MNAPHFLRLLLATLSLLCTLPIVAEELDDWTHSGSLTILTTPEGANLPEGSSVADFPLLVRLHRDFFNFSQAKPDGADVRFSDSSGMALAYEIEDWDAANGIANIWVRIPRIEGNRRERIRIHWGKPDAPSKSNGAEVFNESNGYLSVWHLGEEVKDVVGTLQSIDTGTSTTKGAIGTARHFPGQKGIACGENINNYPAGENSRHTTQAWLRPAKPNGRVVGWGNEKAQGKVVMWFRAPPQVQMECYFSDANVAGDLAGRDPRWIHAVHTYQKGEARLYLDGVLANIGNPRARPLAVERPSRMWIGGWYNNYDFVGDIDEVRVSKVIRSPEWIRLEHENQKPMQSLVGPITSPGSQFSISTRNLTVPEGGRAKITAKADQAIKIYWSLTRNGESKIVATDRFVIDFDAGRVAGDEEVALRFDAHYPDGLRSETVTITIKEAIPEPSFTLHAPANWDGRTPIEVRSTLTAGGSAIDYHWEVGPLAVIKRIEPGKLLLKRAQNSGPLTVTATLSNGGKPTTRSVTIKVTEPAHDDWVLRKPGPNERPMDGQFYARGGDNGKGTLHYTGTLHESADSVFLKLFADDQLVESVTAKLGSDQSYALSAKLAPGLIKYRTEFGSVTAGRPRTIHQARNLVCGDAYLINGQSNAEASDFGKEDPAFRSEWLRSFGSASRSPDGAVLWGEATHRSQNQNLQIGYWGMELGRRLIESQKIPIFLINGAVGGTRIDQHQRNEADPEDRTTIYGRVLRRLRQAGLTHGIRGVLWHQGENDQGAAGPSGGYGWETYKQFFFDLAAAWKEDYPNIQHYYAFQIWPKACSMGSNGSDNRLRDVQRNLASGFSNLDVMSTLGIEPRGTCHYPAAGYAAMAGLIAPLLEQHHYGMKFSVPVSAPNLQRASFANSTRDQIVLEFDQPVLWETIIASQFYLDGVPGWVASGSVTGNALTLKLNGPSKAKTITYLDSAKWSQETLLRGRGGIAALTFCEVPLRQP